ncbi:MAG TPA: hypothetical protein VHE35_08755 [Kofleriaceae bacterium]|nr:hypothetical protein [Kofleriaceae bacterium]
MQPRSVLGRLVLLAGLATVASCPVAGLQGLNGPGGSGPAPRPQVTVASVVLESQPTNQMLAAYYCHQYVTGPMSLGCRVFGPTPSEADLRFTFRVDLQAQNPASIPMPVVSALVAFAAFPEATGAQNLGAVCVSMCEDPNSCPQQAEACRSDEPAIHGIDSFASAAAGFLLNAALTGGASLDTLRIPTVPPGGTITFVARLQLDVNQMLALLTRLGGDVVGDVKAGRTPSFTIPWSVEGSVWVNLQGFGRIGAGFPRQTGVWQLR